MAKRKIEAIIKGVAANDVNPTGGGHPIYYTPSAISIDPGTTGINLNDVSMFSEQDILIKGIDSPDTGPLSFTALYGTGGGKLLKISGNNAEELCDWNSMDTQL